MTIDNYGYEVYPMQDGGWVIQSRQDQGIKPTFCAAYTGEMAMLEALSKLIAERNKADTP